MSFLSCLRSSVMAAWSSVKAPLKPLWAPIEHMWDDFQQLVGMLVAERSMGWLCSIGVAVLFYALATHLQHYWEQFAELVRKPGTSIARLFTKAMMSLFGAGAVIAERSSIALIRLTAAPVLAVLAVVCLLVTWNIQPAHHAASQEHAASAAASAPVSASTDNLTLAVVGSGDAVDANGAVRDPNDDKSSAGTSTSDPVAADTLADTSPIERLELLAIRSGKPTRELLAEALDLLERRYG
jgi:xanthosine utilization system XapX-like protein